MKRIILIVCILSMLLSGCGAAGETGEKHFSVTAGETTLTLDAPAKTALETLGAPYGYTETASCAFAGTEKTYDFGAFYLRTYPAKDGDRILGWWFCGDKLHTTEGISIGAPREQVEQAYGEFTGNACVVTRGEEKLTILLEDDTVTTVQYSLL